LKTSGNASLGSVKIRRDSTCLISRSALLQRNAMKLNATFGTLVALL